MIQSERIITTLLDLLAIPSPCGFTDEIVHYVGKALDAIDVSYDMTRRGTIRARLPGRSGGPARAAVHGYLLHALIAGYPPIQCRQQAASVAARLAE